MFCHGRLEQKWRRDVDPIAEQFLQLPLKPYKREDSLALYESVDQDVDVAPGLVLSSRDGAEYPDVAGVGSLGCLLDRRSKRSEAPHAITREVRTSARRLNHDGEPVPGAVEQTLERPHRG
jgi:hypothetical protein